MTTKTGSTAPQIVVLGAGTAGRAIAAALAARGARVVIADAAAEFPPIANVLALPGRIPTALWGSIESGFSIETDTAETITGVSVVIAEPIPTAHCARKLGDPGVARKAITGVEPVLSAATGETTTPGVFIAGALSPAAMADAVMNRLGAPTPVRAARPAVRRAAA